MSSLYSTIRLGRKNFAVEIDPVFSLICQLVKLLMLCYLLRVERDPRMYLFVLFLIECYSFRVERDPRILMYLD